MIGLIATRLVTHCFGLVRCLEWWDHNHEQWKNDSKKARTATITEIKIEDNVIEKASTLVAMSNSGGKVSNTFSYVINNTDCGATNHMTFNSRQISSFRHSSQKFISIVNGNTTLVIGEGSLTLTITLKLDFVLIISSLNYNFLYVSQINAALSCNVIFWHEFCVFKDIRKRQTIGYGIKRGKFYYLNLQSKDSSKLQQALMTYGSKGEKKKFEIWL